METAGLTLIGVGLLVDLAVVVFAVRAAVRGQQTPRVRNAMFASFGVMVAGVSLLAFNTGLLLGQIVGVALLLTAAIAIVLPMRIGASPRKP